MEKATSMAIVVAALCWLGWSTATTESEIETVVVIGIDGLSPRALAAADTPNIDRMIAEGASTMTARATLPTDSTANWASLITGLTPAQHGFTENAALRDGTALPPVVTTTRGSVPTIFSEIRRAKPFARLVVFSSWARLFDMFPWQDVTERTVDRRDAGVMKRAAASLETYPALMFLHLDSVDHSGHEHGYTSEEHYEAIEQIDAGIGALLDIAAGTKTLLVIVSDHGSTSTGHGGTTLAEVEIPLIFYGAGVRSGHRIEQPVNIFDVAPTITWALGVEAPSAWVGKPVKAAFSLVHRMTSADLETARCQ